MDLENALVKNTFLEKQVELARKEIASRDDKVSGLQKELDVMFQEEFKKLKKNKPQDLLDL